VRKNHNKHAKVNNVPPPNEHPKLVAPYATQQLQNCEFIEIWYFTNAGLAAASISFLSSMDDKGLIPVSDPLTSTLMFIPTVAKRLPASYLPDKDLEIEDVLVAALCLLSTTDQARWPVAHVQMMANFYMGPTDHGYHSSVSEVDKRTWVLYHAEQQLHWHFALSMSNTGGTWVICILSAVLIGKTHTHVLDGLREKKEKDQSIWVSHFLPSILALSCCPQVLHSCAVHGCMPICVLPPHSTPPLFLPCKIPAPMPSPLMLCIRIY